MLGGAELVLDARNPQWSFVERKNRKLFVQIRKIEPVHDVSDRFSWSAGGFFNFNRSFP